MVLIVDNYDSFVFNVAQILEEAGAAYCVRKNDDPAILDGGFDCAIISPGPSVPDESGLLMRFVEKFSGGKLLGICLGHQAICEFFGAKLRRITPAHGAQSELTDIDFSDPLWRGVSDFRVGRYHSWSVERQTLPPRLRVLARADGEIMAVRLSGTKTYGLQFHPESFLTPAGGQMLRNWLDL